MNFISIRRVAAAVLLALSSPALAVSMEMGASKPAPMTAKANYRFELAGPARSSGGGKSIVSIRIVHVGDNRPVLGAIVIQSRADMGPIGMAAMTATIKSLGEQPPGVYRFEVENGSVWRKPDNWSLSFSAKVQGVARTVSDSVIVKLTP